MSCKTELIRELVDLRPSLMIRNLRPLMARNNSTRIPSSLVNWFQARLSDTLTAKTSRWPSACAATPFTYVAKLLLNPFASDVPERFKEQFLPKPHTSKPFGGVENHISMLASVFYQQHISPSHLHPSLISAFDDVGKTFLSREIPVCLQTDFQKAVWLDAMDIMMLPGDDSQTGNRIVLHYMNDELLYCTYLASYFTLPCLERIYSLTYSELEQIFDTSSEQKPRTPERLVRDPEVDCGRS